jgi:high-affinity iron transporter
VEAAFGALRVALAGQEPDSVRARADALQALLFGIAEGEGRRTLPFMASLMIYFREGIEAALIVGALLATLRRLGRSEAARSVHAGWLLALPAGVVTWWIFDRVLVLGADRRELVEASVAILAAAVLFSVSFWLVSRAESHRWMSYLRQSVEQTVARPSLLTLAGIAFIAAYREAAETVLFTRALLLSSEGSGIQVALGALSGTLLAVAAAFVMNRTVRSLPIAPFFAVSGALLCLLAISFAGAGIYGLVRAGYLPAHPVPFPELPWIGVHPDLTALVVQLVIVGVIVGAGLATLRRRGEGAPS